MPTPESPLTHNSAHQAAPIPSLGARLIIYIPSVVFSMLAIGLIPTEINGISLAGSRFPWLMFLQEGLLFAGAFLPAWLLSRMEHRPAGDYGLPIHEMFGARFWQGCFVGLAEISLLIGCIGLFGGYTLGAIVLRPAEILQWLSFWLVFFVVVGLYEEFVFRGYLQFTMTEKLGFWPAAWILSLGFGALHLLNRGENIVGATSVAVVGLVFALALQRTGNLWFVVGWHAAFDFGETFLFSVPNSGILLNGHLSQAVIRGPAWLTGGSVGPEGSVFSFLIMGISALLIHKLLPQRRYRVGSEQGGSTAPQVANSHRTSSETNTN